MRIVVTPGTFRGLTKMPRDAAEVDPVSARNRALRMPRAKKPMPRIDFFDGDMGHGIRQMNKYSLHCIHIQWAFRELQAPLFGTEGSILLRCVAARECLRCMDSYKPRWSEQPAILEPSWRGFLIGTRTPSILCYCASQPQIPRRSPRVVPTACPSAAKMAGTTFKGSRGARLSKQASSCCFWRRPMRYPVPWHRKR